MQECYISKKDYALINEEVDRYKLLKKIYKKIKSQLIDFEGKVLNDNGYKKGVDEFIKNVSNKM